MPLDLANYEKQTREAIQAFWGNRQKAQEKQRLLGGSDQGERSAVTGGKNMDGFIDLVLDLVRANGLGHAQMMMKRQVLTLPGYFRPTKLWDLLVLNEGRLVAALEFKSQVGPSFGNNTNNRAEEAIGTAHDLWTAYREGAFGKDAARPFVGWLMLLEDAPGSRAKVRDTSPHFPIFARVQGRQLRRTLQPAVPQTCAGATLLRSLRFGITPQRGGRWRVHRARASCRGCGLLWLNWLPTWRLKQHAKGRSSKRCRQVCLGMALKVCHLHPRPSLIISTLVDCMRWNRVLEMTCFLAIDSLSRPHSPPDRGAL